MTRRSTGISVFARLAKAALSIFISCWPTHTTWAQADTAMIREMAYTISGFTKLLPIQPGDSSSASPTKTDRHGAKITRVSQGADKTGAAGFDVFLDSVTISMPGWIKEYAEQYGCKSFHLYFDSTGTRFLGAVGGKPKVLRKLSATSGADSGLYADRYTCILNDMDYTLCDSIPHTPISKLFSAAHLSRPLSSDLIYVAHVNYTYSDSIPRSGWLLVFEDLKDYQPAELHQMISLISMRDPCRLTLIDDLSGKALFVGSCPTCYWQLRKKDGIVAPKE